MGEAAAEQGPVLGPDGQPLDAAANANVANLVNLSKQQVGHKLQWGCKGVLQAYNPCDALQQGFGGGGGGNRVLPDM